MDVEAKDALYIRTEDGKVYGPANIATLVEWAKDGRIDPSSLVSKDRLNWTPVQLMKELEMKWLIETEPGKVFGPFNRALVIKLFKTQAVPEIAKAYRLYEYPVDEEPPPEVKIVEKIVEKEVRVEVPVEVIVEKEVPPPARTDLVLPEVVDPIDVEPPMKSPGSLFGGMDRQGLAALEAAAQRELAKGKHFGIFGRRHG